MPVKGTLTRFDLIKNQLNNNNTALDAFNEVVRELHSVLVCLRANDAHFAKKNVKKGFNSLIGICLKDVPPALIRVFNVEGNKIKNAKKFKRMEEKVYSYLSDITVLSNTINDPDARELIVRLAIMPLVTLYKANKKISRPLLKQMIIFWSMGHKNLRVISFTVIYKVCQSLAEEVQEEIIKSMYGVYIRNCKFTSPSSLILINFMRATLTEMYMLNEAIAYKQAFTYTRQMAIHLRNASTSTSEVTLKIVYNWQFVHALNLWTEVLSTSYPSKTLEPLIYPVVQLAIGLMSARKTAMFHPLVLTVCKILISFSKQTKVFIPVLPYLLEIVESDEMQKKPKKDKPEIIEWDCVLSLSRSQLDASNYVEGLLTVVLKTIRYYVSMESASVSFPEFSFVTVKKLSAVKLTGEPKIKIKKLIADIKSNSEFIEKRRADIKFKFSDLQAVRLWEVETTQMGTPLSGKMKLPRMENKYQKKLLEPHYDNSDEEES